jgi:ABC-2 type transport system ATP-binding protein
MEYLNFIGDVFRIPAQERRARIDEYAAASGLGCAVGFHRRFFPGMKQKLGLIASLIHDPANWVLDEPWVGLDPQSAFELKEIMRNGLKRGNACFSPPTSWRWLKRSATSWRSSTREG